MEKKQSHTYEGMSLQDFTILLNSYDVNRQRIALILGYSAGLRVNEIILLKKDDFDFEGHKIKVHGKGGKVRFTILPRYFKKEYLEYIPLNITKEAIEKMFIEKSLALKINRVLYTFQTKAGKTRNKYKYHFHTLRHNFAVNLLAKGVPINVVQILLGHSNIATTSIYTKISTTDAIDFILKKGI